MPLASVFRRAEAQRFQVSQEHGLGSLKKKLQDLCIVRVATCPVCFPMAFLLFSLRRTPTLAGESGSATVSHSKDLDKVAPNNEPG